MKKLRKSILINLGLTLGLVPIGLGSSLLSNSKSTSESIELKDKINNSSTSEVTAIPQTTSNDVVQNIAFHSNGKSYAKIENSNGISKVVKVDLTTGQQSDLWTTSTSKTTSQKIVAINFLQGSFDREDSLLVLVEENNNLKLISKNWNENQIKTETIITITEQNNSTNNTQYFVNVNNFLNLEIEITAFQKTTTTYKDITAQKYKYGNLVINNLSNSSSLQLSFVDLNLDSTVNYFSNESEITNFYSDSNNYYYFFQNKKTLTSLDNCEKFGTVIKVAKKTNTIASNNVATYDIDAKLLFENSAQRTNNYEIESKILDLSTNEKIIFISGKKSPTASSIYESKTELQNILVSKINLKDFSNFQNLNFEKLINPSNENFKDVKPIYDNNSNVNGFVCLPENEKKIYFLSNNLKKFSLYADLSSLNGNSVNSINQIITIKNDTNWYLSVTKSSTNTLYQYSGQNFIGELSSGSNSRKEIPANISFKSQSEIDPLLLIQKTDNKEYLKNVINENIFDFVNVISTDPMFGTPKLLVSNIKTSEISGTKNKMVTIEFSQQLRQNSSGSISGAETIVIGIQSYKFTNENLDIKIKEKNEVSYSIRSKLPSEVTKEDLKYLIDINNAPSYDVSLEPNDVFGILTLNFSFPSVWINNELIQNYKTSITIGDPDNPYFQIDLLNGLSSKVDLVTDEYINNDQTIKNELSIKYGTSYASSLTKKNVLDDFVKLGEAFSNTQLLNQDLIVPPTEDNVTIVPVDSEGYAYVKILIPKIGTKTNIVHEFNTAAVFDKNLTASQNASLVFKPTKDVLQTQITISQNQIEKLESFLPSTIASRIESDPSWLMHFADISYFILNMIYNPSDKANPEAKLKVSINDGLGQITIGVEFKDEIPGLDGKVFSKTFSGFATQGVSGAPSQDSNYPTFSWGEIDPNQFSGKIATDITIDDINEIASQLFVMNGAANGLKNSITITPVSASAAVVVTITFEDWWEKQKLDNTASEVPVLLDQKTFTTVLTHGLRSSRESINTIVWKSFEELDPNLKTSTAGNAMISINSSGSDNLSKLLQVANVSQSLQSEIQKPGNSIDLSITADDALGTLSVYAKFNLSGKSQSYGTKISGFDLHASNYSVSLVSNQSPIVEKLRDNLPSQITDEQVGSLINVNVGADLSKKITTEFDDINGTLEVTVELVDVVGGSSTAVTPKIKRLYTGFKTNVPEYKGTNFLIVGASIVIPILLLLPPILVITLYMNKRDIKRFNKLLEKRLEEKNKKKKPTDINSIEDLLTIDKD